LEPCIGPIKKLLVKQRRQCAGQTCVCAKLILVQHGVYNEGIISTGIAPFGERRKAPAHSAGSLGAKYGSDEFVEIDETGGPARVVGL
jgi:hypothetical protein